MILCFFMEKLKTILSFCGVICGGLCRIGMRQGMPGADNIPYILTPRICLSYLY